MVETKRKTVTCSASNLPAIKRKLNDWNIPFLENEGQHRTEFEFQANNVVYKITLLDIPNTEPLLGSPDVVSSFDDIQMYAMGMVIWNWK